MATSESSDSRLDPVKDPTTFLDMLRRVIFDVAPYSGVIGVALLGGVHHDAIHNDASSRLTADRCPIPLGLRSRFDSFRDAESGETLLDLLVRFYREILDFSGDIVVTLFEAEDRPPLAGVFDGHTIYVEFGTIRAEGYVQSH
jgi:hypothetical protein